VGPGSEVPSCIFVPIKGREYTVEAWTKGIPPSKKGTQTKAPTINFKDKFRKAIIDPHTTHIRLNSKGVGGEKPVYIPIITNICLLVLVLYWYNKSIIKEIWGKHKRIISIAFAVLFLVALFLIKNRSLFLNEQNYQNAAGNNSGLDYATAPIGELVGRDFDADGVLDWEESLWGTDPLKMDTDGDGVMDDVAIEKLKKESAQASGIKLDAVASDTENLSATDQFSRELFATVASLGANGALDETTVEQIGEELANKIQNPVQRKVFTLTDLKIISDTSKEALQKYNRDAGAVLFNKYPLDQRVYDVVKGTLAGEDDLNVSGLSKLDPIVKQLREIVKGLVNIPTPVSLATIHLDAINAFEKMFENLNDMKMINDDPLVAMGAINQYLVSSAQADAAVQKLAALIIGN
jgi:hypothetical protein